MREDITLRDLIEMILKRKKVVCIITAIAMVISGVYGFFVVKPSYEATTVLLTNPIEKTQSEISEGISEMIDSLVDYPTMTIDTYKEQVINNTVLTNTINELQLTDANGVLIDWSALAKKISVNIVDKTNLLKIRVEDRDPERAAKIANAVSENFIEYISNNTRKFGEQATSVIEEQLKEEEKKLEKESKKVQEYLTSSHNVEQLKMEINSLYEKINTYNMELINIEKQILTDGESLKVLTGGKSSLGDIELSDNINLNIPLNDSLNHDIEVKINFSNELQKALVTIKVTEIETRLIQNQADKKSLEAKIKELEERLKNTQATLAEEEYKYNAVLRNYNLQANTYNAYLDRHKEALLAATSNIGESVIIISSPATIPLEASNHGKLFYLVIGTIVGGVLGILIAFIAAYWEESDPKKGVSR